MTGDTARFSRRKAMQITIAASCCGTAAQAQTRRIDQVTDPMATAATGMFRFTPDLVMAEPHSTLNFLNSRGEHTVHSVPQLWPTGVPDVAISNQPEAVVTLLSDGLYAFRCKRHGQYGMVMLVVAGDPGDLSGVPDQIAQMRARDLEKQAFLALVERVASAREG